MSKILLSQKQRALSLAIKIALLFGANYLAFNKLLPQLDNTSFWFLTCLLNIVLGNELLTPFFVRPADALSYAVSGGLSILFVFSWDQWTTIAKIAYVFSIALCSIITIGSLFCIFLSNSKKAKKLALISNSTRVILEQIGTPRIIYSSILLFSILAFHFSDAQQVLVISIAWVLIIAIDPINSIIIIYKRIKNIFSGINVIQNIGKVVAFQQPNIILISQQTEDECSFLDVVLVNDSNGLPKINIALDYIGRYDGVLLRTVEIEKVKNRKIIDFARTLPVEFAYRIDDKSLEMLSEESKSLIVKSKNMIGIVSQDTNLTTMQMEIVKNEDISEGSLVETTIGKKNVLYQIINGVTKEEIVDRKNTFGYAKGYARKIGEWEKSKRKFVPAVWIPNPNEPVYKIESTKYVFNNNDIGHFPNTQYGVEIADINSLVTHNTAILGILGIGKSMLAIEIVERIINEGIKVICLDLTNQYMQLLSDFIIDDEINEIEKKLQAAGEKDIDKCTDNPSEGGSLPNFRETLAADLYHFLKEQDDRRLKIINPSRLFASKQIFEPKTWKDGNDWRHSAGLYRITPVEVTQVITETVLEVISDEMVDKAKVCMVYEEAHALIPEWNSIVVDSDKNATSGTARAILQGRKYGLGCVLITQRTANVTKTILNQCNSVFAMRTFDNTGIEYLENYIGEDYSSILTSLQERQAVYFGKSSSCENPVLLRLNDRGDFISHYRKTHNKYIIDKAAYEKEKAAKADFPDDIP
jgi:hypothetical protein